MNNEFNYLFDLNDEALGEEIIRIYDEIPLFNLVEEDVDILWEKKSEEQPVEERKKYDVPKYGYEDVKSFIKFNEEENVFLFPVYDERKHDVYKKNPRRVIKGGLEIITVSKEILPLGVVEVTLNGMVWHGNTNNGKHSSFYRNSRKWQKPVTIYFYYDFETTEYRQTNPVAKKENERTTNYKKRMEYIDDLNQRFKVSSRIYFSAYDMTKLLATKERPNENPEKIIEWLEKMLHYFNVARTGWIGKLVRGEITKTEYDVLVEKQEYFLDVIKIVKAQVIELNQETENFNNLKEYLYHYFTPSDENPNFNQNPLKGFFSDKYKKTGELYPNFATVEERGYLLTNQDYSDKERKDVWNSFVVKMRDEWVKEKQMKENQTK